MSYIYYKEWIKTRIYLLVFLIVSSGFAIYSLLKVNRVSGINGVSHAWEVMLTHDVVFVDMLQYVPVLGGLLLAVVQFVPEMYHKCLKLTLHLPVSHFRLLNQMLGYGVCAMLLISALNFLLLWAYLQDVIAVELWSRILLTAAPWYLAGLAGYLLGAWVVLEPAWRRRIFNIAVAVLVLRVYFVGSAPASYTGFLPVLAVYTLLLLSLSWISITHFKEGKE